VIIDENLFLSLSSFSHYLPWKKGLIALFENLVDSKSMSVGKWMNQNFCRSYQMRIINSLLLNVSEFDGRPSVSDAARCCELRGEHLVNIIRSFIDPIKKY